MTMGVAAERSGKVTRNAAAMVFSNFVGALVSFAVVPFTLSGLGTSAYGVMQTMLSLGGLAAVGDLGLGMAIRTQIAQLAGRDETDEIRARMGEALVALGLVALLILGAGALALPFIDFGAVFHLPPDLAIEGRNALIVAGVSFAVRMPLSVFASAHAGLQIGDRLVGFYAGGVMLGSIAAAVTANVTHRVDATLAAQMLVVIGSTVIAAWAGSRIDARAVPRLVLPHAREMLALVRRGLAYYTLNLETTIIGGLDNLVIAVFVGPAAVTAYSVTHRLISFAYSLVYSLAGSFWSGVANAIGGNDIAWIHTEAARLRRVGTLAMTLLAAGFVATAPPVIRLWTRGQVQIDPWLGAALGAYFVLNGQTMFDGAILAGAGKLRGMLVIVGLEALVNLAASVALAKWLGYVGVGLGTLIAYALCDFVPLQILSHRLLRESDPHAAGLPHRPRVWTRELSAAVPAVCLALGVHFALRTRLPPEPAIQALACGGVSLVITLLVIRVAAGAAATASLISLGTRLRQRLRRASAHSP